MVRGNTGGLQELAYQWGIICGENYKLVYINHVLSGNTVYGIYLAEVKFNK